MTEPPLKIEIVEPRRFWRDPAKVAPMIIAFLALALAVWEGVENRAHNRLSAKPRLQGIYAIVENPPIAQYSVRSSGLGPAIISSFRLFIDGVQEEWSEDDGVASWTRVLEQLDVTSKEDLESMTLTYIGKGVHIRPGMEHSLLEVAPESATADRIEWFRNMIGNRLDIVLTYESVYGDQKGRIIVGPHLVDTTGLWEPL